MDSNRCPICKSLKVSTECGLWCRSHFGQSSARKSLVKALGTNNRNKANRLAVPYIAEFKAALAKAAHADWDDANVFMRHPESIDSNTTSVQWYTPLYVFEKLQCRFDVDVASPGPAIVPWIPATEHITENSLEILWKGFVWMNPPFGKELPDWVDKFISHGNGIALVADRTYSRWWQRLVKGSERVLFVSPRIQFISPGRKVTNSSIGSTLVSIGVKGNLALQTAAANGLGVFAATTCYQSVFLRNADPLLDK